MHERHIEVPRTARYCVLGDADTATEVWFVLHGYGQLARDFIEEFRGISDPTRLIIAPEALSRFYNPLKEGESHAQATVGATWMTREDREHEIEDYVRYLDELYRVILPGDRRVRVLAFSQGTATGSRWAALGEARLDDLILWGGWIADDLDLRRYESRLRTMRMISVAGERDEFMNAAKISQEDQRLQEAGLSIHRIGFRGGHRLDRDTLQRLTEENP